MVTIGVYVIRNRMNGRVFVNGSMNLPGAMNRDRFELKLRAHRNKKLLQEWLEYGPDSFAFEVVDTIRRRDDPEYDYRAELDSLLQMWRDEFQCSSQGGYNPPSRT
jgi:hypothetical protein